MTLKGINITQEHKNKISKSNKGIHLNKTNAGELILKDGKKLCQTCKQWKIISNFDKRLDRPIGIKSKCKSCSIEYRKLNIKSYKLTCYKSGAKKRGIEFNLTEEQFTSFWQNPCYYCGSEITTIGLDRINSDIGYNIDNIVPCCAICNTMKLALPRDIFINHCEKIINHQSAVVPD